MATTSSMGFLMHLIESRVITVQQADDALEAQRKSRATIGQIALRLKILSVKQIFEVMRIQLATGARFGEIAVDLGFMNPDDVRRVLAAQDEETTDVGAILVQMGVVSVEVMKAEKRLLDGPRSLSADSVREKR
jgi:hypothetical protein